MIKTLLQWATGLGKTKKALDCVKGFYSETKHIPTILILVAELAHITNWLDEIKKWKCKTPFKKAVFSCYNSIGKYENQKFDYVIMDECHHLFSERRIKSFINIQYNNIILLSATLTNNNIIVLKSLINDLQIDTQSLKNCINEGKLIMPKINIIDKLLSTEEKRQYTNICKKYEWAKLNNITKVKQFAAINRKRFIALSKTNVLRGIINKLRKANKRFVCYCSSIQQMKDVSGNINCVSSQHKSSLTTIQKFNNEEISELFFCNIGIEGLNLTNIEVGVICQADANTRPFIQKIGRVLRNKVNPEVYLIKAVNTVDEQWIDGCINQVI